LKVPELTCLQLRAAFARPSIATLLCELRHRPRKPLLARSRSLHVSLLLALAALATASSPTSALASSPGPPETQPATEVTGVSARLHGVLDPNAKGEPGTYDFLYNMSATECEGGEATPRTAMLGERGEAVTALATALLPVTKYTYCLLARNGAEETTVGAPVTFETSTTAPDIAEETFVDRSPSEVIVGAEIAPGGEPATYRVEYEPGKDTEAQSLPASSTPVHVQVDLTGLVPAIEYHFRFLAQNEHGPTAGALLAFTTSSQGVTTTSLPDDRHYELVSPISELEVYAPPSEGLNEEEADSSRPYRASVDGDVVTYAGEPPSSGEGGNGSQGPPFGNEYLADRGTNADADGWEASDITPLARNGESRYEAFSNDLATGVFFDPNGGGNLPPLAESAPVPCEMLYRRTVTGFDALFTNADVQNPGFCGLENEPISAGGNEGTSFVAPYSQLLFQTSAALTPESVEAPGDGQYDLYDSAEGHVSAVNMVGGIPVPSAVFGAPAGETAASDFSNVISADGSRVFWSAVEAEGPTALYVREDPLSANARTVQLDEAEAGAAGPSGAGRFWTASADGSRVFFTDCNRLVEGSTADNAESCSHGESEEAPILIGSDLYEYDFAEPVGDRLTDLTVDHTDPGGADIQGVMGAAQDGEYVYVVAGGVLATNENQQAESAQAGQPNLYMLHHGSPTVFIATLSPEDNHLQGFGGATRASGDWRPGMGVRTAEVSQSGRSVVFESRRPLTGYENQVSGGVAEREVEIFLYDAEDSQLTCVSCNPGSAPVISGPRTLPGKGTYLRTSQTATFMPRSINEAGTEVFFNTGQPLVPQDTNAHEDVYEWEQEGHGTCPAGASNGGCVYLLSGGTSSDQSLFVDASASGEDVFFTTRAQLVPQDRYDRLELYDTRVGGGFSEPGLACSGSGCQPAPSAPLTFSTPPTLAVSGIGNYLPPPASPAKRKPAAESRAEHLARALKSCRAKHNRRTRRLCERRARKQYAPAKRPQNNRRRGDKRGGTR
jgi:hypothetical protein